MPTKFRVTEGRAPKLQRGPRLSGSNEMPQDQESTKPLFLCFALQIAFKRRLRGTLTTKESIFLPMASSSAIPQEQLNYFNETLKTSQALKWLEDRAFHFWPRKMHSMFFLCSAQIYSLPGFMVIFSFFERQL